MAERAAIGDSMAIGGARGCRPAVAAGLGIAGLAGWLPLAWRAPLSGGENVLVLGATGRSGSRRADGKAARRRPGRRRRTERHGPRARAAARADATVSARRRRSRCGVQGRVRRRGPSYVFDPLGRAGGRRDPGRGPARDDRQPRPVGGRDPELASAAVRFKNLSILGHTNFAVPEDELDRALPPPRRHVTAGDIVFDVDRIPLDDVASAGSGRPRAPAGPSRARPLVFFWGGGGGGGGVPCRTRLGGCPTESDTSCSDVDVLAHHDPRAARLVVEVEAERSALR